MTTMIEGPITPLDVLTASCDAIYEATRKKNVKWRLELIAQRREEDRLRDERVRQVAEETNKKIIAERKERESHAERIRSLHHFVWVWESGGIAPIAQLDASVPKNSSYLVGDIWDSGNGLYRVLERRWINNVLNINVELT